MMHAGYVGQSAFANAKSTLSEQATGSMSETPSFVGLSNRAEALSENARSVSDHIERIMDRLLGSEPKSEGGGAAKNGPRPVEPHLSAISGGIGATETYLAIIRSQLNRLADHVGVDHA